MRRIVYGDIREGDLLEVVQGSRIGETVTAFFSQRHTARNALKGQITVRVTDYQYLDDQNCHGWDASYFQLAEIPYDPTQQGETEDDI